MMRLLYQSPLFRLLLRLGGSSSSDEWHGISSSINLTRSSSPVFFLFRDWESFFKTLAGSRNRMSTFLSFSMVLWPELLLRCGVCEASSDNELILMVFLAASTSSPSLTSSAFVLFSSCPTKSSFVPRNSVIFMCNSFISVSFFARVTSKLYVLIVKRHILSSLFLSSSCFSIFRFKHSISSSRFAKIDLKFPSFSSDLFMVALKFVISFVILFILSMMESHFIVFLSFSQTTASSRAVVKHFTNFSGFMVDCCQCYDFLSAEGSPYIHPPNTCFAQPHLMTALILVIQMFFLKLVLSTHFLLSFMYNYYDKHILPINNCNPYIIWQIKAILSPVWL